MEDIQLGQDSNKRSPIGLAVLVLLGLVFVYLIGLKTELTCTRSADSEVDCMIISVWMGRLSVRSREALEVRNAFVEESYDFEEDSTTYRVVLKTRTGDVPVTSMYSSGNIEKRELSQEINAFIQDQTRTEAEFSFSGAGSIISVIVIGVFLVLGIGFYISRSRGLFSPS